MNTNEKIIATGELKIVVTAPDGTVKHEQEVKNLVVTTGLGFIASRMKDTTATVMSHMAIGTGSTAAAANNTTLGTESARVALTSTTVTAAAVAYVATFPAGTPASLAAITVFLMLLLLEQCFAVQCSRLSIKTPEILCPLLGQLQWPHLD